MADNFALEHCFKSMDKINPITGNNYVVNQVNGSVEAFVDSIWQAVATLFPPGLKYVGGKRCSPDEEIAEKIKRRSNVSILELSRSNVYLMKYGLELHGQPAAPIYLYLPFVDDAGSILIDGSQFNIFTVLADNGLSVGPDSLYIKLIRAKITFKRSPQSFFANDQLLTSYYIHGRIHNHKAKNNDRSLQGTNELVKIEQTLVHYLLCKYGLMGAFAKYGLTEIQYGNGLDTRKIDPNEYVVCRSRITTPEQKPKFVSNALYTPSDFIIVIPRKNWTPMVQSLVAGLFYVVDHYPSRINTALNNLDDTRIWRVLLGHGIYQTQASEGKLEEDINNHISSIDKYIDMPTKLRLREEGIYVDDFYDLMAYIIENLSSLVINTDLADISRKRLTVNRYVCSDIENAIVQTVYSLITNNKKELTINSVNEIFRKLRSETILQLKRGHGEITSISYPGDNKLFKHSLKMVSQLKATDKISKHGGESLDDPTKALHCSILACASYANQPKSEPDGRSYTNPYVGLTSNGGFIIDNKEDIKLLQNMQSRLKQ